MKVVIQRVLSGSVVVSGGKPREIGRGLVCLFGMGDGDDIALAEKLAHKTANLRIFEDGVGKMNLSAAELGYDVLAVPQFTLFADTKKGLRPSFIAAADPAVAKPAFERYVGELKKAVTGTVAQGEFGADMQVSLINDGPVTIIMDTKEWQQ